MVPEPTPRRELPRPRTLRLALTLRRLDIAVNLPNLITLARLVSVPVAIWLVLGGMYAAAFWIFVAAGLSDAIDGYIAKRFDLRTPLGAVLDPAADKALLTGLYVTLFLAGHLPGWLVSLVVLRDGLIVLGYLALRTRVKPNDLGPLFISKVNTLMQIALVGCVLARLGAGIEAGWETLLLISAAAATTVLSGLSYLVRWGRILVGSGPAP